MNILETISFDKVHAFHEKHSNIDLVNSYFIGICTTLFPSVQSLSIFESTLAWKLSISSKSIKLGKWEVNNLAHYIHRLSKSDSGSVENVSFVIQLKKFEEKIEYWFKDFGAMKILFPSFTSIQWFHIGSFMATQTSLDLIVLLSMIESDFSFQTTDLDEYSKGKFLKSLLESNYEVLKKSNSVQSLPKIDIDKLRRDVMKNETQKDTNKGDQKKGNVKAIGKEKKTKPPNQSSKTQQNTKATDSKDKNLFFEALYKVKSAVVEPVKEKEVLSTSKGGVTKNFIVKKKEVECSICLEMAEENSLTSLLLCQHSFHLDCLQQYLKSRIDERNFPMICPMDKCSLKIFGAEIPKLLDEDYKKKYHTYSLELYIETHPGEFFRCPGVDCKSLASRKDTKSFYCSTCKKVYCVGCSKDVHEGMTCKEYEITMTVDLNDELFKTWEKNSKTQKCSKCNYIVHKTEGCNHITCRCTHQFCYLCGALWKTCPCEQSANANAIANAVEDGEEDLGGGIFGDDDF